MQRKVAGAGHGDGGCGQCCGRGPGGHGGRGHGHGGDRGGKPTVSARNFNDNEWGQFTLEEQVEVARLRDDKKQKRMAGISALCSGAADAREALRLILMLLLRWLDGHF
eukprot:scaffold53150_cov59-Attheya_sp.AAC.2